MRLAILTIILTLSTWAGLAPAPEPRGGTVPCGTLPTCGGTIPENTPTPTGGDDNEPAEVTPTNTPEPVQPTETIIPPWTPTTTSIPPAVYKLYLPFVSN